ncbi:MAG: sensor histidine kinase [Candidatus Nanopelagicales bacterium]
MSTRRRLPPLSRRMLAAQMQVTTLAGLALVVAVSLLAPNLFAGHLAATGETDPAVQAHAEQAFVMAGAIALGLSLVVALGAAAVLFRVIGRRVSRPVEQLAAAADTLATGRFAVDVPAEPFSDEVDRLGASLARMGAMLERTERARSRLLSDLAHEMRTPLATLELYAESLRDEVVPIEDALATIDAQIRRLQRLSQDLRDVALAEEHALAIELDSVDLATILTTSCIAFAPRFAAAGVALEHPTPDRGVLVNADSVRLQQVLGNLLDNALRHTSSGGHVEAALRTVDQDALISIADDGTGLAPDQLEVIFDRFYRVDPSRTATDGSGSGLGLTIARAIVEAHGGTLTATSRGVGRGATFLVGLPLPVRTT